MAKLDIRLWSLSRVSDHIRDETKELLKYDVGISFFAGVVGAIIEASVFWDVNKSYADNLGPALLTAFVVFLLASNLVFIFYRRKKDLSEIIDFIDARMHRVVQHFALGTANGDFDETIRKLTDANLGKVTWLVAKFIAEKLDRVFRDEGGIAIENMDLQEFSNFQSDIIRECETSIYLTCPFTPTAWFDSLVTDGRRPAHKSGIKLEKTEWLRYFKHLVAFNHAPVEKKRIVVLEDAEWDELLQNEYDFEEFCRVSKGENVQLRFVKEKGLSYRHVYDLAKEDYGIYDGKVVLFWKPNEDKSSKENPMLGTLKMIFEVGEYREIFKDTEKLPFKSESEVRMAIKQRKTKGVNP